MLKLTKCAYIFHWSNSTYFHGTKEQLEKKRKINKALKAYYDDANLRDTPIAYTVGNGYYNIVLDGEDILINENMIECLLDNPEHVINHRRSRDFSAFDMEEKHYKKHNAHWLTSNKFKTLWFESFMVHGGLNYYRVHFKNNRYEFIIDDRNCTLYAAYGVRYAEIDVETIIQQLDITSPLAKKEFMLVMDYLVK